MQLQVFLGINVLVLKVIMGQFKHVLKYTV